MIAWGSRYTGRVRWWLAAVIAAFFLLFYRLAGVGLLGPDEPRYAWVGRAMAGSGDWVTPRLWGEPWFEKPPLLYWITAAAFRAGLGPEAAPRLPVAALSAAFLLFYFWRMRAEFGPHAAAYASAVLATSAGWLVFSHAAVLDLPLAATFGASMLLLLGLIEKPQRRDSRTLVAFGALLGLSTLAKGLVGPALAALALAAWAARAGWRELLFLARPGAWLAFAAVAAPWYLLCWWRSGNVFLAEFFWKHHFSRYAAGSLEHNQPVWFFAPVLAGMLLPWTPLAALLGRAAWSDRRDRRVRLLACWAATTFLFFSFSRDKLPGYVLPALPAIAALAGMALARNQPARAPLAACAALLALFGPAAAMLPAALESGFRASLSDWKLPAAPLAAAAALTVLVWILEHRGRRPAAVAAIALAAVAGYTMIQQYSFPALDQRAGARALWRKAEAHRDQLCLGEVRRHVAYGLHYYAGRRLPRCVDEPQPYRVENREIVQEAVPERR